MSKFTILLILTTPIIISGIVNNVVSYKLHHIIKSTMILRLSAWALMFVGILFSEDAYQYLISRSLTDSDPLSIFDVIQITAILLLILLVTKAHSKIHSLEDRLNRLHREITIQNSKTERQ